MPLTIPAKYHALDLHYDRMYIVPHISTMLEHALKGIPPRQDIRQEVRRHLVTWQRVSKRYIKEGKEHNFFNERTLEWVESELARLHLILGAPL